MYTMKQTCDQVNMSYETLKFYCNAGLVPNVQRDKNNRRIFDENNINWIRSLTCLKNCGMSIKDMQVYLDLCLQGKSSIPERKVILDRHKVNLVKQVNALKESIRYIDEKQKFYDEVLCGETEYFSYLIDTSKK